MQISRIGSAPAEDSGGGWQKDGGQWKLGTQRAGASNMPPWGGCWGWGKRAEAGPGRLPALLLKTEPRKTFFLDLLFVY